ncbi:MAG: TIGR03086 family protein [Propionibacteriales bacterium]|nr:TIGR03086 family protein [Propionibacteriales bacterium]
MNHDDLTRTLIPAALETFGAKVHDVPTDRWDTPTPCTEWSVRDLVNHLAGEHFWAPHLLRGETLEQVGDRYDGDLLGDDPVAAWESAAAISRAAWSRAPSAGTPVHVSFGQIPLEEYAGQMYVDLVVHGWDLARGAGLDATIDSAIAQRLLTMVEPNAAAFAASGVFGPPVAVDSANPADRLLGMLGRDPR